MTENDFIPGRYQGDATAGTVGWHSPSNIALVKYWGKLPEQIPANPSVSFTLDTCRTTTRMSFQRLEQETEDFDFDLYFEGERKDRFTRKTHQFFQRCLPYLPFLRNYHLRIDTSNSFPHSSGLASSASGMSALALCLMDLEKSLNPGMDADFFLRKASFLARLGSGSACRSLEGPVVVWGRQDELEGSSDLYGIRYPEKIHEIFRSYRDTILLVDRGEKKVSSSIGHELMKGHPYADSRFRQARGHIALLKEIFGSGDLDQFIRITESEALSLHSMMMTGSRYFILMKPGTLSVIQKVLEFREATKVPLCFTLDAGANVHLLYPGNYSEGVQDFIQADLLQYCEEGGHIHDQVGLGAQRV